MRGELDEAEALVRRVLVARRRHKAANDPATTYAIGLLDDIVKERRGRRPGRAGNVAHRPRSPPQPPSPAPAVPKAVDEPSSPGDGSDE